MIEDVLKVNETAAGFIVQLHVQPRAKRNGIVGFHAGALKVKIVAPPVDDAANRAIIEYFSKMLGISKSSIKIMSGEKSRDKSLQISGLSSTEFRSIISRYTC